MLSITVTKFVGVGCACSAIVHRHLQPAIRLERVVFGPRMLVWASKQTVVIFGQHLGTAYIVLPCNN